MRISAKGRYGLASMVNMALQYGSGEHITIISIAEKLGISKIYLEQVFSLLKRAGLVSSVKGAQGGYQLTRMPSQISAYDILNAIEFGLFEATEDTVSDTAPDIELATQSMVYKLLDQKVEEILSKITLDDILLEVDKIRFDGSFMIHM